MPDDQAGSAGTAVSYRGTRYELRPGAPLSFGRAESCTVVLDPDDRGISRLTGSIDHDGATWWVTNHSAVRALTVVDDLGIRTVLAPERRLALTGPVTIVVEGSARRHALEVTVDTHPALAYAPPEEGGALPTVTAGEVTINDQDRLALVALFAGYLETFPRYDPHPRSYADAAAAVGWPRTTLVKRVEYLRVRLTGAGVPNLVGDSALEALAEWALTTRVIGRDDLVLLQGT